MFNEIIERLNTLGMPGEMCIANLFCGTRHEAKVMRMNINERFCVHLPEVRHPIWCDSIKEVMRVVITRA